MVDNRPIKVITNEYKVELDKNNNMILSKKGALADIFPDAKRCYKTDKELIIEYLDGTYARFERSKI